MLRQTQIRKTLSLALLALFAFYYANANFFWHDHSYCGYVIIHSHIHIPQHNKSCDGGHNDKQIQIISDITHSAYNNDIQVYVPYTVSSITIPFVAIKPTRAVEATHFHFDLRAPPAFLEIA